MDHSISVVFCMKATAGAGASAGITAVVLTRLGIIEITLRPA